jgi:hypothetical protein
LQRLGGFQIAGHQHQRSEPVCGGERFDRRNKGSFTGIRNVPYCLQKSPYRSESIGQ